MGAKPTSKAIRRLPKRMAAHYAAKARAGHIQYRPSPTVFIWFQGYQEICLLSLDPPVGYVLLHTEAEYRCRIQELT